MESGKLKESVVVIVFSLFFVLVFHGYEFSLLIHYKAIGYADLILSVNQI